MGVPSSAVYAKYTANGATTVFAYPFKAQSSDQIDVLLNDVVQVSGFTISGLGVDGGGNITFSVAPANGVIVYIRRNSDMDRDTTYTESNFLVSTVNSDQDYQTMLVQEVNDKADRSMHVPQGSGITTDMPTPQANYLLAWNSGANALVNVQAQSGQLSNVDYKFSSVAAMSAQTGMANGALAQTFGYYTNNDGGHGQYRYDSTSVATVNGCTVINAFGGVGRWLLLHQGVIRSKQAGAKGDDTTNDSAALNAAAATGLTVIYDGGRYKASGLTQNTANQKFIADGSVRIIKNANGTLFSITANDVFVSGILFAGDASTPTFTGDNVVSSANNTTFFNCGSMWAQGRALKATGSRLQIYGSNAIWQTADATATGYDIEVGQSGVATLYHEIHGYQSSQSTGGIKLIDVGSHKIIGGQFGKYTIAAGTSPPGVNGGNTVGARILGNIDVGLANASFAGNTLGAITCTFAAGTSGHAFDDSNIVAVGGTLVDNSSNSRIVDSRLAVTTTYSPSWTAATTNPVIGNGTITGRYIEVGKLVTASINIVCGSTTTYGSGDFYISLPSIPSTAVPFVGSITILDAGTAFFVGSCQTLTDSTARLIMYTNNSGNAVRSTVPMTWATGDELRITVTYLKA